METFNDYINNELDTIREFTGITKDNITLRKVINNSYSPYDFTYASGNTICIAEVKTRNCSSTYYPDTILELSKVNNIFTKIVEFKDKHPNRQFKPVFIVKFTDGMYLIDMTNTPVTMGFKWCDKNTAKDGNNKKELKPTVHYNINNAIKIR